MPTYKLPGRPGTTITSFRGLMLGFTPESGEYRGGRRFRGVQGLKDRAEAKEECRELHVI
jgi:hypothetical protein